MPHSFIKIWIHAIWAPKEMVKPFLKYMPFHSPWFKPWAMEETKHNNRFNGFKNQRL